MTFKWASLIQYYQVSMDIYVTSNVLKENILLNLRTSKF